MSAVLSTSANRTDAAGLPQRRYYVHQDYCGHGRLVVDMEINLANSGPYFMKGYALVAVSTSFGEG